MQHRDSRPAVSGTAALKLRHARFICAYHSISLEPSNGSRQIDGGSACHPAGESRNQQQRSRL